MCKPLCFPFSLECCEPRPQQMAVQEDSFRNQCWVQYVILLCYIYECMSFNFDLLASDVRLMMNPHSQNMGDRNTLTSKSALESDIIMFAWILNHCFSKPIKLPSHYFPISTNQLAVLLTECWTAKQILTVCCVSVAKHRLKYPIHKKIIQMLTCPLGHFWN